MIKITFKVKETVLKAKERVNIGEKITESFLGNVLLTTGIETFNYHGKITLRWRKPFNDKLEIANYELEDLKTTHEYKRINLIIQKEKMLTDVLPLWSRKELYGISLFFVMFLFILNVVQQVFIQYLMNPLIFQQIMTTAVGFTGGGMTFFMMTTLYYYLSGKFAFYGNFARPSAREPFYVMPPSSMGFYFRALKCEFNDITEALQEQLREYEQVIKTKETEIEALERVNNQLLERFKASRIRIENIEDTAKMTGERTWKTTLKENWWIFPLILIVIALLFALRMLVVF